MANSLVKLTLESNQYEKGLRQAQKQWDQFTKGIGLSVSKFTAVSAAVTAVTGALKVANDAFNSSRNLVDEWGRTMQSAEAIYGAFINTLNTGNFSGFFENMGRISQAARDAYDAVSDLQLLNAYNSGKMQSARTGLTGSIADFRSGDATADDVKAAAEVLKAQLRERKDAELKSLAKTVDEEAAKWNMDGNVLSNALKEDFSDFMNRMNGNLKESYSGRSVIPMFNMGTVAGAMSGRYSGTQVIKTPSTNDEKLADFARRATPELIEKLRKYEVMSDATEEEIKQIDKQVTRMLGKADKGSKGVKGGGGGTTTAKVEMTELQQNQSKINLLTQEYVTLGDVTTQQARDRKEAIQQEIHALDTRNNKLKLYAEQAQGKLQGGHVMQSNLGGGSQWSPSMSDKSYLNIGAGLSDEVMQKVKVLQQSGISASEAWKRAGTAVGLFGSAISAIKDPAAQVAATVAQAIASIALAYSQALAEDQSTKPNIFAFLAASATAMVSMVTAIAQIRSSTSGYAHGGIVDGNSYSGDNIPIMANAGELVLTKAAQASLANHLEGGGMSGLGPSRISGEQIYITLNRYLKRSGQGELMTWG